MSLKIKLWGVRGSLPSSQTPKQIEDKLVFALHEYRKAFQGNPKMSPEDFLKAQARSLFGYGGHTMCVEVITPKMSLFIDGGSGLRLAGDHLMFGPSTLGGAEVHILMTHFHWDHLIGLPFFSPIFVPGNQIHFYAVQEDLEDNIRRIFQKPNFPVPFQELGAKLHFHSLKPRVPVSFEGIQVTPYQLDHPDPCWGYRFDYQGKSYAHCVDGEFRRASRKELGPDLPMYTNADVMLFDAQYSFLEASERINWGHASAPIGVDLAIREGIKKVLFVHHDPASTDEKIAQVEAQTVEYVRAAEKTALNLGKSLPKVEWCFAWEGMVCDI